MVVSSTGKISLLIALFTLFIESCASYAARVDTSKNTLPIDSCKICCDGTINAVVNQSNYFGFKLKMPINDFEQKGFYNIHAVSSSSPSDSIIRIFEEVALKKFDSIFHKKLVKGFNISNFADYLRQYSLIRTDSGRELMIINFSYFPKLNNFCSDYFKYFSNELTLIQWQQFGYNFFIFFDTSNLEIFEYSEVVDK